MNKITKKQKFVFTLVAIGLIASLFFSSASITGNSVLNLDSTSSRNLGTFLLVLSLAAFIGAKYYLKK